MRLSRLATSCATRLEGAEPEVFVIVLLIMLSGESICTLRDGCLDSALPAKDSCNNATKPCTKLEAAMGDVNDNGVTAIAGALSKP